MALNGHTICVLYIISCCFTVSTAKNVSITDGATLRQYLCPDTGTLPPNTHLLLSKPQLVIPDEGSRFCLIENTTNLSISPSQDVLSEGHDRVNISCNGAEIGFGFFNVKNLTISSVLFNTCGGHPTSEVVKYVNETNQFLYYNSSVLMVLFFSHCYSMKLHNISTGGQFVVGVNLCGDSEIKTVIPNGTSEKGADSLMMTLLVYFTDTAITSQTIFHCNLNITSNSFYSQLPAYLQFNDTVKVDHFSDFTLLLTQSFLVTVHLIMWSPPLTGHSTVAIVAFVNSDTASQVSFQGYDRPYKLCVDPNVSESSKLILAVYFYDTSGFNSSVTDMLHPMHIHNTAFTASVYNSILVVQKVRAKLSHRVSLDNVSWCLNHEDPTKWTASESPALFLAENLAKAWNTFGELHLSVKNILTHSNFFHTNETSIQTFPCQMYSSHIKQISMTGTNYFTQNSNDRGTVIKLVASELAVSGNLSIMGGHAQQGGGIFMDSLSSLVFEEPLVAGFYNNIADQGSAIYAPVERNDYVFQSPFQVRPNKKYSLSNVTSINISLFFWNNTNAIMHRSFYAPDFSFLGFQTSPNLLFTSGDWDYNRSQFAFTTLLDTILHMDRIDKYTSLSNGLCIQPHQQKWKCGYLDRQNHQDPCRGKIIPLGSTVIYPGQKAFTIHHLDANQMLEAGYCDSHSSFIPYRYSSVIKDNSTLSFKFSYSSATKSYIVMFTDLSVYASNISVLQFHIRRYCPLGFNLQNGSCTCDKTLTSHGYSCDIDTETITSPPGYWTGLEEQKDSEALLFGDLCHPNYCDSDKRDFRITDDPAEACLGNRTGVLCGECKENYSVVFGSDTCYDHCTDVYLLIVLVYAMAGVLLIFLLFALRITVATGAINGLIFYANVLGLVLDHAIDGGQSSK